MLLLLFLHQVTPRLASAVVVFKSNLNTFIKLSTPNLWDCGWRTVCCCDILCKLCEYVFKWIFWSCFISIIKYLDYDMWYIHKMCLLTKKLFCAFCLFDCFFVLKEGVRRKLKRVRAVRKWRLWQWTFRPWLLCPELLKSRETSPR